MLTIRRFAPFAAAVLLAGCSTYDLEADRNSAYSVNLTKGAAAEIDHPAYDPEVKGYWLVGTDATLQFTLVKDAEIPEQFCFMLRTKPDASTAKPSEIDVFKILTPQYRVVTKFNPAKPAPVDILTYKGDVLVKSDDTGKYIRFERVGERVKVILTKECLRSVVGADAAISWTDYPPSKKSSNNRSPAEAEGWRRVL